MLLDQAARDIEAETCSNDTCLSGIIRTHEAPEDKALLRQRNADAVIPCLNFRNLVTRSIGFCRPCIAQSVYVRRRTILLKECNVQCGPTHPLDYTR